MRRRAGAIGVLTALAIGGWALVGELRSGGPAGAFSSGVRSTPDTIFVRAGARTIMEVPRSTVTVSGQISPVRLGAAVDSRLPGRVTVVAGRARIDYALGRISLPLTGQDTNSVRLTPVASTIPTPVVTQKLHNDCEAAALQVLLATTGIAADQLTLQSELPRSGPIDPVGPLPNEVWGDPAQGFVGRADGAGPAGGFGVYQAPIARLGQRYGAHLRDVTGSPSSSLYRNLLAGHAVMAWVGLADGPYGRCRSPTGAPVSVNLNEHTVVLTGISADGTLEVVNPLTGARERWKQTQFETMWNRLGRRALAT